jgi:hypothetical protein
MADWHVLAKMTKGGRSPKAVILRLRAGANGDIPCASLPFEKYTDFSDIVCFLLFLVSLLVASVLDINKR